MDSNKKNGGLIYQCQDLINIVNEPEAVGVAFSLEEPGVSPHLHLKVYKVVEKDDRLFGDLRKVKYTGGAERFDDVPEDVKQFKFERHDHLERCGFSFAYLEKDKFLDLIKGGEPEIFLSGAVLDYGSGGPITGEWFSLKIVPRKPKEIISDALEGLNPDPMKSFGVPPNDYFIPPCPPIWRKSALETESMEELKIEFSKVLHTDKV